MASAKNVPARLMIRSRAAEAPIGRHLGHQGLLVDQGQVQRLQPQGHRLASQSQRRLQARRRPLLKVLAQRRLIGPQQRCATYVS